MKCGIFCQDSIVLKPATPRRAVWYEQYRNSCVVSSYGCSTTYAEPTRDSSVTDLQDLIYREARHQNQHTSDHAQHAGPKKAGAGMHVKGLMTLSKHHVTSVPLLGSDSFLLERCIHSVECNLL